MFRIFEVWTSVGLALVWRNARSQKLLWNFKIYRWMVQPGEPGLLLILSLYFPLNQVIYILHCAIVTLGEHILLFLRGVTEGGQ